MKTLDHPWIGARPVKAKETAEELRWARVIKEAQLRA
jgi:hypothetical protein